MRALLIGILLLLLLIPGAQAVELKSYKIVAEIQGDVIKEELLITLQGNASTDLRQGTRRWRKTTWTTCSLPWAFKPLRPTVSPW